jgi:hypothetical protein
MNRLNEDKRQQLIAKSKSSAKGNQRFKRRMKSRVAKNVKNFNSINMDKLFKQNILDIGVQVHGETDDYIVTISFGGFLDILKRNVRLNNNHLDLRMIIRSLMEAFNSDNVYIRCTCPDWQYRFAYYANINDITVDPKEDRPSKITNPKDTLGSACKHVLLVLSNNSWLIKVASVIHNYIRYMEQHMEHLYVKVIYPTIFEGEYGKEYQLPLDDTEDTLASDSDTIDSSNEEGRKRGQFKKDNPYRFKPYKAKEEPEDQISLEDDSVES